ASGAAAATADRTTAIASSAATKRVCAPGSGIGAPVLRQRIQLRPRRNLQVEPAGIQRRHHLAGVRACQLPPGMKLDLKHRFEPAEGLANCRRDAVERVACGKEHVGVVLAQALVDVGVHGVLRGGAVEQDTENPREGEYGKAGRVTNGPRARWFHAATLRGFPVIPVSQMRPSLLAFALLLGASPCALAQTPGSTGPTPITLDQAMADPDWIGPPVEAAWWAWDGQRIQYNLKREGEHIRDTWQVPVDGGTPERVDGAARAGLDGPLPAYDATRSRMAFVRNGDVFVRDLRSGALTQVTRTDQRESRPQWSRDGNLVFRAGNDWFQ